MHNSFLIPLLIQNASDSLNPIDLIFEAGWVVKTVMGLLLLASVVSWTIIFWKIWLLRGASRENIRFADAFWSAGSLESARKLTQAQPHSGLSRVFESGLQEFNQISDLRLSREQSIELLETNVSRSLDKAVKIETQGLQSFLGFLANTASTAPFVGLFGTVWGIMNSFINIGATGASNLGVVAPGIAEALIATAMGLFAAIPAALAYNTFASKIRLMTQGMRHFTTDFMNTAKRSL